MIKKLLKLAKLNRTSDGLTSIVIVVVLVALLTTVALGFAIVMNREQQKSVQNQEGQAAYDAAASGINDVISYLKDQQQAGNNDVSVTDCSTLLQSNGSLPPTIPPNLSSDGSTKYTCALVDSSPTVIKKQKITADKSEVLKLSTASAATKLMISWQATDRSYNGFVPFGSTGSLFDETKWTTKGSGTGCGNTPGTGNPAPCAPLLRLTLYPTFNGDTNLAYAAANAQTYYLYPTQAPSQNSSLTTVSYSSGDGTPVGIRCGNNNVTGQFSGSADYDCNVLITSLSSDRNYIYYAKITPLYDKADIEIKANAGNAADQFVDTQAVIDVTAQSGQALKRLEAQVDTSNAEITPDANALPEQALRSAVTVCKRLVVPSDSSVPVYVPDPYNNYCNQSFTPPQPPSCVTNAATNITATSAKLNGTCDPNGLAATNCHFEYGTSSNNLNQSADCTKLPTSAAKAVTKTVINLTASTPYYYRVCASNKVGQDCGSVVSFTTSKVILHDPLVITGKGLSAGPNTTYQNPDYTYSVDGYITGLTSNGTQEAALQRSDISNCFFAFDNDNQMLGSPNSTLSYQASSSWNSFFGPEGGPDTQYYEPHDGAVGSNNFGATQFPCATLNGPGYGAPGGGVTNSWRAIGTFDKNAWLSAGHNIGDAMWYQLCASVTGGKNIMCGKPNYICLGTTNPNHHTDEAWCGIGSGGTSGGGGGPGQQTVIVDCYNSSSCPGTWSAHIVNNGDNAGFWHCDQFTSQGGSNTSSNYSLSGFTATGGADANATYIKCFATDGAWGDNVSAPNANLTITHIYIGAWDQGVDSDFSSTYGECGPQAHFADGSSANNTWWCRNGTPLDGNNRSTKVTTYPAGSSFNTSHGCADGNHRWTVCNNGIYWNTSGGQGTVACALFQSGNYGADGAPGRALISQSGNPDLSYNSPAFGWVNVGSPYPFLLQCYDQGSHSSTPASYTYNGNPL